MCDAETRLGVQSFFVMDENFLLYKDARDGAARADEGERQGLVALRLLVGQRALASTRCANWSSWASPGSGWGWKSPQSQLQQAEGHRHARADPRAAVARHPRARARPSSASSTTRPRTSRRRSSTRCRTTPTSTSSCSTRRCPARRSTRRWWTQGRLLPDVDLADIHGQYKFNFQHAAISRDESKTLLDWAFRLDYERNGPSLYRLARTMMEGWRRYRNDPDPRVRAQRAATPGTTCAPATARRCWRWRSTSGSPTSR